jgi:SAM-dependent methyltransferase
VGLRSILGVRRRFTVDGVRYRECAGEPIRRALSRKGRGRKEYDVVFPGGDTMRIEVTHQRRFADITGHSILDPYRGMAAHLRPGMRMVMLQSGTGLAAAWAARLLGPAGAVVALDRDEQSIQYALRRYRLPNISFETGGVDALAGEVDSAFDAALAIGAIAAGDDARAIIAELWRVLGPSGVLILASPQELRVQEDDPRRPLSPEELALAMDEALAAGPVPENVSIFRRSGWTLTLVRRTPEPG